MSFNFDLLSQNESVGGKVVPIPEDFILNKEQVIACDLIIEFMESDEIYFNLRGKGGTGKTTVIAEALKGYNNIIGITTSHKAKSRLSESIKKCYTLASALGMKLRNNDDGTQDFVIDKYAKRKAITGADIIVFDECSMASIQNIKDIHSMKLPQAKVIYMGDFRQLPPIDGSVKSKNKDSRTFRLENYADLTIRMRQGIGNPIIELSDVIASEIEGNTFDAYIISNFLERKINEEGKGYDYITDDTFIKRFIEDFKKDKSTKFICFRNATIKYYNRLIRKAMYSNADEDFIQGELLMARESFLVGDEKLLINSEEYTVKTSNKETFKKIECYMLTFEKIGSNTPVPVPTKEGLIAYKKEVASLARKAKRNPMLWKNFWSFKGAFAQLDYAYCINSHRSQGSTYRTVYLDFNDILTVSKTTDKEKCQSMYVGITRASHNLYLLDI